jgi:hypothetical protein
MVFFDALLNKHKLLPLPSLSLLNFQRVRRWVLGAHAREQAESTSLARAEKLNRMKQAVTYNCQKILTKNFSRSINPA